MKILGFDESFTTCDLCGKSELKGTYAVEHSDGQLVHYGSTCYGKARGIDAREARAELKSAIREIARVEECMMIERRTIAKKEYEATPECIALQAAWDSSRGIVGVEHARMISVPYEAAATVRAAIAAKHNVPVWRV